MTPISGSSAAPTTAVTTPAVRNPDRCVNDFPPRRGPEVQRRKRQRRPIQTLTGVLLLFPRSVKRLRVSCQGSSDIDPVFPLTNPDRFVDSLCNVTAIPTNQPSGRVTEKVRRATRTASRPAFWIPAVALLVVIAFIGVIAGNGGTGVGTNTSNINTATTLVSKPILPGDNSTVSTLGGSTARCKDGTYTFRGGPDKASDEDLCKNNGGVDQHLP